MPLTGLQYCAFGSYILLIVRLPTLAASMLTGSKRHLVRGIHLGGHSCQLPNQLLAAGLESEELWDLDHACASTLETSAESQEGNFDMQEPITLLLICR